MFQFYAGWIGGPELIIILVVVLLLFGGKKIPELARGIGKGIRDFRKAADESGIASDLKDISDEFREVKKDVDKVNPKKAFKADGPAPSKKKS